ncbi:hypothetical protein BELL_1796g00010 [Botrytis elliptica]|uniref:Major facilitator superfamily (MFS) profile domain-containing protein n=1 Tax=Botrytis elliptica TaxID=278938 RepID=A0A4Z1HPC3_9HELO|nr:hypothetical protein BELL_1796g00010 [Botrytis elliptica]
MVNYISVRGSSPVRSGVDYIPLALAELFGIMLSGAMINKFGHYIPFIFIGQTICAIGTGLLTTLNITTSTIDWATFLVICGFGIGMGINAPHVAIQAVFNDEGDVFVANGVATFFSQLGGSIAVSIGNSFLVNGLAKEVPRHTSAISPQAVIDAGPFAVQNISADSTIVNAVQESYANSISHVFIFATAIVCFSMPMAAGMEWLNLNTISQGRKHGETKHENSKNEALKNELHQRYDRAYKQDYCAVKFVHVPPSFERNFLTKTGLMTGRQAFTTPRRGSRMASAPTEA